MKISNRLKNDVLFISVDGALGDYAETRLKLLTNINSYLKSFGLRSLILCPRKEYGDINTIPYFGLCTDFRNEAYNYSYFMLKHLITYINHLSFTHVCIWQNDGYPINLNLWDDIFLDYDFIGYNNGSTMNGGFSLRSKNFLIKVANTVNDNIIYDFYKSIGHYNEDVVSQSLEIPFNYPKINIINKFCKRSCDTVLPNSSFGFHFDGSSHEQNLHIFSKILHNS